MPIAVSLSLFLHKLMAKKEEKEFNLILFYFFHYCTKAYGEGADSGCA